LDSASRRSRSACCDASRSTVAGVCWKVCRCSGVISHGFKANPGLGGRGGGGPVGRSAPGIASAGGKIIGLFKGAGDPAGEEGLFRGAGEPAGEEGLFKDAEEPGGSGAGRWDRVVAILVNSGSPRGPIKKSSVKRGLITLRSAGV
jgi:phage tail protein X